jgi:hypothetical protein
MTEWTVQDKDGGPGACGHAAGASAEVAPGAECEDCVREGGSWVHLRRCLTCDGVRCCDSSPAKHASTHAGAAAHPVAASAEPGEHWAWCYTDDVLLVPAAPGSA